MEESMKKVLLISLFAMMLIGMLSFSACQPQPQEETADETMTEEVLEETQEAVEEGAEAIEEAVEVTE